MTLLKDDIIETAVRQFGDQVPVFVLADNGGCHNRHFTMHCHPLLIYKEHRYAVIFEARRARSVHAWTILSTQGFWWMHFTSTDPPASDARDNMRVEYSDFFPGVFQVSRLFEQIKQVMHCIVWHKVLLRRHFLMPIYCSSFSEIHGEVLHLVQTSGAMCQLLTSHGEAHTFSFSMLQ